ncbi:MAG: hypothetical protein CFH23_00317, partial [Alphaproteobacteria bacterium MarineAlpha6_Bin1]
QPSRFIAELPKLHIDTDEEIFDPEDSIYVVDSNEYEERVKNPNKLLFNRELNSINKRNKKNRYKVGDEIFHEKYGYGIIKYIANGKLEIVFDKSKETKIVLESFIKPI